MKNKCPDFGKIKSPHKAKNNYFIFTKTLNLINIPRILQNPSNGNFPPTNQ